MKKFKDFIINYRGAIVGAIVAMVALMLRIHEILIGAIIIVAGMIAGNYVQQNKEKVKETIRRIVDRW